jgi:hypothetical protein
MKRITTLITIALGLALAGNVQAATHKVYFEEIIGSHQDLQKPRSLLLTADGTLEVLDVHWSAWGGKTASGTGNAIYHSCNPDCARGVSGNSSVKVRLANIRSCDGRKYYTHLTLIKPDGHLLDARYLVESLKPYSCRRLVG